MVAMVTSPHTLHSHSVRYLAQYLTIDADYEKM